ncbi:MAG TPA: hypothetical protein VNW97_15705 [Candidatus Saccharimonadales bacterium]|jgi:hypothetical protein|nr:hypothetical protein [Candidatus Saccharimonadales bacterium]
MAPAFTKTLREWQGAGISMDASPGRWSARKYISMGLIMVAAGLFLGKDGLEAFRTGKPIYMPSAPAMEGWLALIYSGLTIFFGLCLVAVGMGWMKMRGPH